MNRPRIKYAFAEKVTPAENGQPHLNTVWIALEKLHLPFIYQEDVLSGTVLPEKYLARITVFFGDTPGKLPELNIIEVPEKLIVP